MTLRSLRILSANVSKHPFLHTVKSKFSNLEMSEHGTLKSHGVCCEWVEGMGKVRSAVEKVKAKVGLAFVSFYNASSILKAHQSQRASRDGFISTAVHFSESATCSATEQHILLACEAIFLNVSSLRQLSDLLGALSIVSDSVVQ